MSQVNEEKIILNRLLFKENQLKKVQQRYLELFNKYDQLSEEQMLQIIEDIEMEQENLEFQIHKAEMVNNARIKDKSNIQYQIQEQEQSIQSELKEISQLQQQLKLEERKSNQKMEYNLLAQQINKYETIEQLQKKIQENQAQIEDVQNKHEEQMEKINLKEKQIYLTVNSFIQQKLSSLVDIQDI